MKIGKKEFTESNGANTITGTSFVITETLPNDYTDITSVKTTVEIGLTQGKDYKWIRRQLQAFDFDTLTDEEKLLVAQHKATTETNCKSVLGSDYVNYMTRFDIKSIACRELRFSTAKSIFFGNVSLVDRYAVLGFLSTNTELVNNYIQHGVEGTNDGDPIDGFFNYVEATGVFALSGIAAGNYTMLNGLTKQDMIDLMMECLRNGNY